MNRSLIVRINVMITLILSLCLLLFGLYGYFLEKRVVQRSPQTSLDSFVDRLSSSLKAPLWNVDGEVLELILETEMQDENVVAITVVDRGQGIINISRMRNDDWEIVHGSLDSLDHKYLHKTKTIKFGGTELGQVSVYFTDRFFLADFTRKVQEMAVLLLLFFCITVVVLSVFLNRVVVAPIRELTSVSEQVAGGDFDLAVETGRTDELGVLAARFDYMRLAVREKVQSLNEEIGEREKIAGELLELQSLLTSIINSMPSTLIGVDHNCLVTFWNEEAERLIGIAGDQVVGQPCEEMMYPFKQIKPAVQQAINDVQTVKKSKVAIEFDGEDRFFDITAYPLTNGLAKGAVIRIDDVSDRVRLEEVMVQAEKMMSVGGLAAGMAHEINNPLAGIMQNIQVIRNRLSPEMKKNRAAALNHGIEIENIVGYLDERGINTMFDAVVESGEQAAKIVNNMLTFSRKSNSGFLEQDIVDLLENTLELSSKNFDLKSKVDFRDIVVIREYGNTLPKVACDASMIQQVFLNILLNGAQSLFEKKSKADGEFTPQIVLRIYGVDESVKIEIEDNGMGMEQEMCRRIFEPFYTTKEVGIGTGLGLSVSYFIVAETHKGRLEASAVPDQGALFTIILPCLS